MSFHAFTYIYGSRIYRLGRQRYYILIGTVSPLSRKLASFEKYDILYLALKQPTFLKRTLYANADPRRPIYRTHYNLRFNAILKLYLKAHSHDVRLTHVGAAADRCGAVK